MRFSPIPHIHIYVFGEAGNSTGSPVFVQHGVQPLPRTAWVLMRSRNRTHLVHPSLLPTLGFHHCQALPSGQLGLQGQECQGDLGEE